MEKTRRDQQIRSIKTGILPHFRPVARKLRIPITRIYAVWQKVIECMPEEGYGELEPIWNQKSPYGSMVALETCPVGKKCEFAQLCPMYKDMVGPITIPQVPVAHTKQWKRWRRLFREYKARAPLPSS